MMGDDKKNDADGDGYGSVAEWLEEQKKEKKDGENPVAPVKDSPSGGAEKGTERGVSFFSGAILLAVAALLGLMGWGLVQDSVERPQIGDEVPDVPLAFFEGYEWDGAQTAMLSDMEGEIVVLNFWASWCVECTYEAADLEQTWRAYADQGVVFLGIAYTDIDSQSLEFLQEYGITYPNAPDFGAEISEAFQLTGVPETVIIDREGRVAISTIGPVKADGLAQVLDRLLAE